MKFDKVIKIIFILICISFIIIPLIKTDYTGGKKSSTEKRILAVGLGALFDEKKDNFSVTKWIGDNIGFRDYMVNMKSNLNYNIMNTSPTKRVDIGRDGWLFYTVDDNLKIASGKYPLDNKIIDNISTNMYKCQQKIESMGIKFVTSIAPSKVSIYPEYIKGINKIADITPIDMVRDKINPSVNFIDIKKDIIKYKQKNPENLLYWKGDTHWTGLTGYIGYLSILDKINELYKNDGIKINPVEVGYKKISIDSGDLVTMFGKIKPKNISSDYLIPYIKNKTSIGDETLKDELIKQFNINKSSVMCSINKKANNNKTILLLGDSFSIPLFPYLQQNFYKVIFIRHKMINNKIIDFIKPDIFIILHTERYTNKYYKEHLVNCVNLK